MAIRAYNVQHILDAFILFKSGIRKKLKAKCIRHRGFGKLMPGLWQPLRSENGCEKQICIGKHKQRTQTHTPSLFLSWTDKHDDSYFSHREKSRCCNLLLLVLSEWKTQLCAGNDILQIGLQLLIGIQRAQHFSFSLSRSLCPRLSSLSHTHTYRSTSPLVTVHNDQPIQSTILWTSPTLVVV